MSLVGDCCGENGFVDWYLDGSPKLDSINKTGVLKWKSNVKGSLSGTFINISVVLLKNNLVNLKD